MNIGADSQGAYLEFVTRRVIGDLEKEVYKYNVKAGENQKAKVIVKNPVIVFIANGNCCMVLEEHEAQKRGFFERPEIINIENVNDFKSPVGRFKNASSIKERQDAWKLLEEQIIQRVLSKSGLPLPMGFSYSDTPLGFEEIKEEAA